MIVKLNKLVCVCRVYMCACKYGYMHGAANRRSEDHLGHQSSPLTFTERVSCSTLHMTGCPALELLGIHLQLSPISRQEHWNYSCMLLHPTLWACRDSNSIPYSCAKCIYSPSPFSTLLCCFCIIKLIIRCCISSWKNISNFFSCQQVQEMVLSVSVCYQSS